MIQPIDASLVIQAPPGMNITWTSVPMEVSGGRAVWTGRLGPRRDIEVRFSPPFVQRVWARVRHVLSTPLIRL